MLLPQVVAGALLVLGTAVRPAALAVVAAGPVLVVLHGPRSLLLCAVLVGIAVSSPSSRRSDRGAAPPTCAPAASVPRSCRCAPAPPCRSSAWPSSRSSPTPAMGVAVLGQQPVLDLLAPLGVSAEQFVVLAGCVELLFGLLVLSGAAPQVVGLVAAVPCTASLALFGTTELMGHLPVYGVLLAFVVLGSSPATADALVQLPRGRLTAVRRSVAHAG